RHKQASDLNFSNPFSGVDTNIEFCLATTDTAGNYSTGVVRHYEPSLSTGPYTQLYDFIDATKWDVSKYCNLYVITRMTNASGVYLSGTDVTVYTSTGFWSGLIGHEIGHYLNLRHTFSGSCKNDNCLVDGDRVCDTPPKSQSGFTGNSCDEPGNSCTTDIDDTSTNNPYRASDMGDQPDILENYMDYTGSCWDAFTVGQKARMRFFMEDYRVSVKNHATIGCANRAKPANEIGVVSFEIETSVCTANATVKDIIVSNYGSSAVRNFSLEIQVNGTVVKTINQTATIGVDAQVTLPLAEIITLQDGENNIQIKSTNPNGNVDEYTNNDTAYKNVSYKAISNSTPFQEIFTSTTWADGVDIKNDEGFVWYLYTSADPEKPCYENHFTGARAYATESKTASITLPTLDLSNETGAKLSFKYGYVQRYDFIADTFAVVITPNCETPQTVWKKFGAELSTGTPSEGVEKIPGCDYDKDITVDLSPFAGINKVTVSFIATGRFYSFIFLDNINIVSSNPSCEAASLTIADTYTASASRFAQTSISSTSTIASGGNVNFFAGNNITLNAGFHAQSGSVFSAKIMDCEIAAFESPLVNQKIQTPSLTQPDLKIYPNPTTTNTTTIAYYLPQESPVSIQVFDWTGKKMINIEANTVKAKGFYEQNLQTENLTSGTYFVRLRYADQLVVKKLIITK
ncbi:MAG: 3-coathanger stack domain-containing protein, partial [Saprospiraceae bacterium]